MPSDPILVLLGPTAWEGPFVAALAHPGAGLTFARRCLDTADLLAAASAGLGRAVVLGADVPRLDADVVMRLSTLGLPVVGVPLQKPGGLPIGVQVIANHYNEAAALRVARHLEKLGVASAPPA